MNVHVVTYFIAMICVAQQIEGRLGLKLDKKQIKRPPVGHYFPMDEIEDGKIIGTINGTLRNGPSLVDGMKGKALHFDGLDQSAEYGLVPCFSDLDQCGALGYTTAMWLRVDNLEGERYILSSGGQTGQMRTGGIAVVIKNGKLQVEIRSYKKDKAWISGGLTVHSTDQWLHLAVTWNRHWMTVFVNGAFRQIVYPFTPAWKIKSYESKMYLGRPNNAEANYGNFAIDEWYYWNSVLSDGEIFTNFKKPLA